MAEPFLKWVGGKRQLLPHLLPRVPVHNRYYEPFVGGGALFFALQPERAVLADANLRLIRTYRAVQNDVEQVIDHLRAMADQHQKRGQEHYLKVRALDVDDMSDAAVAAWFIYLNRLGYNGLYRVNRANKFNVPYGRYENPTVCDEDRLRACSAALAGVEIRHGDFAEAVADAQEGDFAYFDPPYVPLSVTSSFVGYAADGFSMADQVRLRDLAIARKRRGVRVLLLNSSAPVVREMYAGFEIEEVLARRAVNSQASGRGTVKELLIW